MLTLDDITQHALCPTDSADTKQRCHCVHNSPTAPARPLRDQTTNILVALPTIPPEATRLAATTFHAYTNPHLRHTSTSHSHTSSPDTHIVHTCHQTHIHTQHRTRDTSGREGKNADLSHYHCHCRYRCHSPSPTRNQTRTQRRSRSLTRSRSRRRSRVTWLRLLRFRRPRRRSLRWSFWPAPASGRGSSRCPSPPRPTSRWAPAARLGGGGDRETVRSTRVRSGHAPLKLAGTTIGVFRFINCRCLKL